MAKRSRQTIDRSLKRQKVLVEGTKPIEITLDGSAEFTYDGTLFLNLYHVNRVAFDTCGECWVTKQCELCYRCKASITYREIAINTGVHTTAYQTPPLYCAVFLGGKRECGPAVQFYTLVQGYAALLSCIRTMCDPNIPYLCKTWTEQAFADRTVAKRLFTPFFEAYEREVYEADDSTTEEQLRQKIIHAYQRACFGGMCILRSFNVNVDPLISYDEIRRDLGDGFDVEKDVVPWIGPMPITDV